MLAVIEAIERVAIADLRPHPASEDVPKMCGAEWASFLADVGRRGIQEPLVVIEGTNLVLDGRHRLDAAEMSGAQDVPVRYVDLPENEQVDFVIRAAICRRHLNESQRALLAAKIATVGRGKHVADVEGANLPLQTVGQLAELLNVSPRSVKSARAVLTNGHEALADAIAVGDLSVSAAANLASLPPDEQREAVAGGKAAVKAATAQVARRSPAKKSSAPASAPRRLGLPDVKQAFLALSEDDRMAFLDWIDHEVFETTIVSHSS